MKTVVQRVRRASVSVNKQLCGSIDKGLLVLIGIEDNDGPDDLIWMAEKICHLRIFNDEKGVMNLSIMQDGGRLLVVSQFTLCANTQKGHRPSYIKAAKPEKAKAMYEDFCSFCEKILNKKTEQGVFGAHMLVELINDGPVTILLDSKNR
ncbi:MAG: D-tyrosyl-tRNA(Tyr) deacylase [Bacteroidales bacterium]|jgi:D-tyrosyl-tRNA(Tyr) deacylase|nr:D-tyrosyl-tRNA(Tyr) deacylase [Bacteroidales bacterium]MBP8981559.1 D-tyrosyl-tRNA(Tyr) deacylase [Bacteroidales bacterium]HNZ80918.1 D-aminoacyl-tRNA deacylase [Bacteroidales bacterium]HPB35594.1 D-aminoacyl-tRNA deacylase [Bacteroidales bacterium]HPY58634.1 D-aminoacyl-tRNA deacylase [Bacteroidales bacterium]